MKNLSVAGSHGWWRLSDLLVMTFVLVGSADPGRAQAPPIRGEGGNVQFFQGNAVRTFARFVVIDQLRVDGEEVDNAENRRAFVYVQPFIFSYAAAPGLALRVIYPLVSKQFDNFKDAPESNSGFGDLTLAAKYRFLFHPTAETRTDLAVLAGVKLPTGESDATDSHGRRLPVPMQLGTGATDMFWQISASHANANLRFSLFGDLRYQKNFEANDFGFGNSWTVTGGGQKRLFPPRLVTYGRPELYAELALQYQHLSRDRISGIPDPDSGGETLFLAPGLSLILKNHYLLEISAQFPLFQDIQGTRLGQGWNLQVGTRVLY